MLKVKLFNRETEGELLLIGRLDANSASDAEAIFKKMAERFDSLILNLKELDYVSSMGLRALKSLYMTMRRKGGSLALKNVNKAVMEVFEVTGFAGMFKFI